MKWQTKTLAVYIAATVPVEKEGDVNPLLESAKQLDDDIEQDTNTQQESKEVDNGVGSFERFMSSFGSPGRWAGH